MTDKKRMTNERATPRYTIRASTRTRTSGIKTE